MTICKREEELFKEWKKRRESFVRDGVVSEHALLHYALLDAIKEIKEKQVMKLTWRFALN